MRESTEEILGRISGKCAPADKERWWLNEEVQAAVKTKKTLKRILDRTGDQGDKQRYKRLKLTLDGK